jgi:hypothetical protein
MRRLVRLARKTVRDFDARRAARDQLAALQSEADRIMAALRKGGAGASAAAFRQADEYAADVLGSPLHAPWLKVYATTAGEFREGWIPNNYYGAEVITRIDGRYRRAADAKTFINRVLDSPHIPDVAYVMRGLLYDRSFRLLTDEEFRRVLFDGGDRAIFKPEKTGRGKNFELIDPATLDVARFRGSQNGVFQRYVRQHAFFDAMTIGSATTLRLTTVLDPAGTVSVRAALIRVGRREDDRVMSATAVNVPIELAAGTLIHTAYMPDWTMIDRHPDSGFRFGGQEVPAIREAMNLVVALHATFPQLSSIGWDLCIDAGGVPRILEWNTTHNGIALSEATGGPCFADLGWEKLWKEPMPRR